MRFFIKNDLSDTAAIRIPMVDETSNLNTRAYLLCKLKR